MSPAFDDYSRVKPLSFQDGGISIIVLVHSHAQKNIRMHSSKILSIFWTHMDIQKRNPLESSLSSF
jgi:hypothetical protein